jgi:ribosomal protein S18 acetylase RimI-like enzyme
MTAIKPANVADLETIRRLAHEIWPAAYLEILGQQQLDYMLEKIYSLNSLEHQLIVLKHRFIILSEDGITAGFASFSPHDDAAIYHLNKIYVLPSFQGKHFGKKLLDYIIAEIKKTGATSLQLNVNRHNKALHFYEKQGFKIIRKEDIDIGSGYFMNDYVMELSF